MSTAVSTAIVPRWEWRTFGDSFGPAEAMLTAQAPGQVQEADELYLLSPNSDASVKVRDGLMDVKHLVGVDENGLEQWRPVMKAALPLGADDERFVLDTLNEPGLPEYTPVHKRRAHYRIDGCLAELTELRSGERATRTIAVEGEDPERVIAAVRRLGLSERRNVSVARGIKALLGMGAHCYAVIDVGTNSIKLHVAERAADGEWRTLGDRAVLTRLGEGLQRSGRLSEPAMRRTTDAIADLVHEARALGATEIAAVGTAGLRIAPNANELLAAVHAATGVMVDVIPGEEEARLAFAAATAGLSVGGGSLVVFDTGGGSSQFTLGTGGRVDEQFSVNVGSVRLTEHFGLDQAVASEVVEAACVAVAAGFDRLAVRAAPAAVVGMGGAVTNLAAVELELATYDPDAIQGAVLQRAGVERQIERFRTLPADARRTIVGLQPARAEVILAGACIVRTVLDVLGADELLVSDRALRHGLMADRFGA